MGIEEEEEEEEEEKGMEEEEEKEMEDEEEEEKLDDGEAGTNLLGEDWDAFLAGSDKGSLFDSTDRSPHPHGVFGSLPAVTTALIPTPSLTHHIFTIDTLHRSTRHTVHMCSDAGRYFKMGGHQL